MRAQRFHGSHLKIRGTLAPRRCRSSGNSSWTEKIALPQASPKVTPAKIIHQMWKVMKRQSDFSSPTFWGLPLFNNMTTMPFKLFVSGFFGWVNHPWSNISIGCCRLYFVKNGPLSLTKKLWAPNKCYHSALCGKSKVQLKLNTWKAHAWPVCNMGKSQVSSGWQRWEAQPKAWKTCNVKRKIFFSLANKMLSWD